MNKKPLSIWALFASIYITQYIGVAFILASTVVIMRDMGMPLTKIALINVIALPLLLKIFYAPLIDNIRLKQFVLFGKVINGHYRSWLLCAQLIMMVMLVVIGTLDISNQFGLALGLMLAYGFAVSVQDVAIDGLACKEFDNEQRHLVNSIQFSGNLLGNVIGGGLILMAYAWLDWQGSLLVLAGLTIISWFQVLFLDEKLDEKLNEKFDDNLNEISVTSNPTENTTKTALISSFKSLWASIKAFIKQHKVWFGLLMLYPLSLSANFSLVSPLLIDADWTMGDVGFVTKVFGSLVGIVSALSASVIISKLGKIKTLLYLSLAQACSLLALLPLAFGYTDTFVVYLAVGVYFLISPALMTTIATHAMQKASEQEAKATFFTLQIGSLSFMGFVYAGIAMVVAKHVGYTMVMMAVFVLALLVFYRVKNFIITEEKYNV